MIEKSVTIWLTAILFVVTALACELAFAGRIVGWGGQYDVPAGNDFVAISAGDDHNLALKSDGSIVAWGNNSLGECNVPAGNDFVAIDAGWRHSLALKSDGSIVAWGYLDFRAAHQVPSGTGFVAIAAGDGYNMALHSDGSIWGGSVHYPALGNDFVAIAAGASHSLALKSDGSIVTWGSNEFGQSDPPDGNDFVAIAAGGLHSLAIRSDGSLVAWGYNLSGQCDVPEGNDFVAIAAGDNSMTLKSDGSILAWPWDAAAPAIPGFVAIAAGYYNKLAIYPCPPSADLTGDFHVEWYVSPSGSPYGNGSQENPWDFATALSNSAPVRPGDTVWLASGTYLGPFTKAGVPSGSEDAPIIYRAIPGERVTLTATPAEAEPYVLANYANYVWFWGFEVTVGGDPNVMPYGGSGVRHTLGRGCKYINMVVHDWPHRMGFNVSGIGGELYGCLSYRNGRYQPGAGHGFYCQNQPDDVGGSVDDLPWMNLLDCLVFDNYGSGIYTSGSRLANMLYEGVVVYGKGNFLSGTNQHDDNFVIHNCFTYLPGGGGPSAEFGSWSPTNGRLIVENNVFIGGGTAVLLNNWEQLTFQNNTCCTNRPLITMYTLGDVSKYDFDNNTYYQNSEYFSQMNDIDYATFDAWQTATGWDANSTHIVGAPNDVWVFLRPNKYEPDRAHLIIYNWPKTETVPVDMANLWPVENDEQHEYRIVNVEDIWGEPAAKGTLTNGVIEVPMTGTYFPEFACYLVTRRIP